MLRKSVIVLFIAGCCFITAQTAHAAPQWAKTFGGTDDDEARSIQQTRDGGYIVAGNTGLLCPGCDSAWLLKLDASGSVSWQKAYGGGDSEFFSVQQTADGGCIAAGYTYSYGGGSGNVLVVKLDGSGNVVWQNAYAGGYTNYARSIQQTADGGYIVAGQSGTSSFGPSSLDFWILKLDAGGSVVWQKVYGGTGSDIARSIQQTSDGGYIVDGETDSFGAGGFDAWVLKLDASGNIIWNKAYGGTDNDYFNFIQQTADAGYIAVGYAYSFAGTSGIWAVKLDASGVVVWQKMYSGEGMGDAGSSIKQTFDGGYIMAGNIVYGAFVVDAWVLKLDAGGNVAWQKAYGGSSWNEVTDIQQTSDGGYIFAGLTGSFGAGAYDMWVLKLDSSGDIPGSNFISTTAASVNDTAAIVTSSIPNVVAVGDNYYGQCNVGSWTNIVQVAAGDNNTVGLKSDGTVLVVGNNDYGQCNVGSWTNIVQVAVGSAHTVGLKSDGTVLAVGDNYYGECNVSGWTNIVQVAAGSNNTVGLTADGKVVAVGRNDYGQCNVGSWTNIVQVAAGIWHTVGLNSDGTVVAIGACYQGSCDVGSWSNIVQVAAYWYNTVGLRSDGTVVVVGNNDYGQRNVGSWSNIVQVAGAPFHTVGRRSDGTVVAVGYESTSELHVSGWANIVQVTGGGLHTVGLKPTVLIPVSPSCTVTNIAAAGEDTPTQSSSQASASDWVPVASGVNNNLNGVWGTDHQNLTAIGEAGLIRQSTDGGQTWATRASSTTSDLNAIWGDDTGKVYVVGDSGTIRCSSDGGGTWSAPLSSGTSNNLTGVWGSSGSTIYAVGDAGAIVHSSDSGVTWSVMQSSTTQNLNGVWGSSSSDIYAVGDEGAIQHYNGSSWSGSSSGVSSDLNGIWGSGSGDIFVVGEAGRILRYNGSSWQAMASRTRCDLNAVAGTTAAARVFGVAKNVFAAGDNGTILHYDGTGWSEMDSGTVDDLYSAWESVNTHRYVTGTDGLIQKTGVPAIVGYVCNACTGASLASATIDVNNNARQVVTGSSGYYTPLSCDPGLNLIRVTASGMSTAQETRGFPASYSQVPQHVLLMPTDVAQYQWCIAGAVNRKVLLDMYDFSQGIPNIDVRLLKDDGCGGWTEVGSVLTGPYGQYRFTVTEGATYQVALALAPGYSIVQPSNPPGTWHAEGYYQIAMPRVSEGDNPQRFDFELAGP